DRAKTKAQGIVDKLNTGEPFENVAKQFSEDETTKENGGDLGWIKRGILPATMEDAAFALKPGEVSQPVESQIGLHVIKLIEKKTATGADFEAAKPEITAKIRERLNDELAEVSEDQIKKEYEEFHAQHIMIRTKTREQLAVDWVTSEKNSGNHKIEIVNPELKAYRYVMQEFLNPTAGKPDLDQAITLYEKAIDVDPRNAYLYFQLGSIYEQKNTMARVGLDEEGNDPYSFAIADSEAETAETEETEQAGQEAPGEEPAPAEETQEEAGSEETAPVAEEAAPKDPNIYLQEALEAYEQANNVGEETSVYDPMIMISEARIAQKLGKDDSAVERFSSAIDFSVGNMSYLNQIKEGLSEYETETAQKAIDETDELIAELEDLQSMADEPYDEAYEDEMDEEDEYLELETEETTPESDVPVIEENPGSESISAPDTSVQDYEEIPIQTSPAAPVEPAK
ncbi:MAG TPA: peptidylprolyl isomerase, partial [Synergistaceae bacterium]|nr:peptidylprolyl isomerase [Synergistaceae bacterium]